MDKVKKFEDFLDRMQGLLDNAKKQGHIIVRVEDLENTFPELAESEDERIKEDIIWCLKHSGIKPDKPINPHVRTTMKEALAWLEKKGEQKPVEWSEEDKKMFDSIINVLEVTPSASFIPIKRETMIPWLKSLKERVKPKQKQERSEDTQQWIDAIIKDYEEWYKVNKDHRATIQIKIDILKSLKERYTWKPSNEQMENLCRAFNGGTYTTSLLMELYQDLKKLKG